MRIDISFLRLLLRYLLLSFLFFTLAVFFDVRNSYGQEAAISDFTVANSEESLLLYLAVTDWLTEDMEAAIHNGIPITFAFTIDLFAKRPKWPDKKIRKHEFSHVMEYDSLKKQYRIQRNEKGDSKVTASLEEAKKLMSEINGFKVLRLDELDARTSYILRAKAKLARKTMPLSFHYLIPFSSPWDFETEWHALTLRLAL
jgi:hypothetical protein